MIDGEPMTASTGSTVDLSQLNVGDIERIEIAEILSLSNETFSRAIRKLKDEKVLWIENKKIKLNESALIELLS